MLHLAARDAAPAPFAIRLEVGELTARRPGDTVAAEKGILRCGDLVVDLREAPDWRCRPPWRELRLGGARPDAGALPREAAELAAPLARLQASLQRRDDRAADAAVKELAGRGPGLTPAGDDLLLGVVHALWATSAEAADRASRLVAVAMPRTTRLAGAWLCAASRGEAGAPWLELLRALADDDRGRVALATAGLRAWGATSGRVSLAGFTAVVAPGVEVPAAV